MRDGVRRETPVDLPETFNYLIGLRLESRRRIDGVLTITGADVEGRKCLILWRNLDETNAEALDAWFDRHRGQFGEALDVIYANGDHTLSAKRRQEDTWKTEIVESIFRELMFEEINDER